MAGVVLGIEVQGHPMKGAEAPARRMHLFVQEGKPFGRAKRGLGFVLQRDDRRPAPDSIELPGSAIVLQRGEPTDIVVVNRLHEATGVHWHGVELESPSDGVVGWSGSATHRRCTRIRSLFLSRSERNPPTVRRRATVRSYFHPGRRARAVHIRHGRDGERL